MENEKYSEFSKSPREWGSPHLQDGSSALGQRRKRLISLMFLIVSFYSLLLWGYIVARILISNVYLGAPFIEGIPINFWHLGIVAFVTSFVAMVAGVVIREW